MQEPEAEVITALLDGAAHRFADPIAADVPVSGAGIYTVWDEDGQLVYVGVAGRNRRAQASLIGFAATPAVGAAATSSAYTSLTTMCCPT
jgi:hypothetical protein